MDSHSVDSDKTDKLIPVDNSVTPPEALVWDENDATTKGVIDARLTIGVYVDNLQIVHSVSAKLDSHGRGPDGCAYNAFMDAMNASWEINHG